MREIRRSKGTRPMTRLSRGVDGRLRPVGSDRDIADIWAEQKRIQLAEAIQQDKIKTAKKQKRKQLWTNLKKGKPAKELVLPIHISKLGGAKNKAKHLLELRPKGRMFTAGAILCLLVIGALGFNLLSGGSKNHSKDKGDIASSGKSVLGAEKQAPDYRTLLPKDKSIGQLGGWERVSPPDKNPVFAYKDSIGDEKVPIIVSQQPMPSSFKGNISDSVSKLAASFTANQKLDAGDVTFYVGTSIKGPQSVIMVKEDLLILIKSNSKLTDPQWIEYVQSLN